MSAHHTTDHTTVYCESVWVGGTGLKHVLVDLLMSSSAVVKLYFHTLIMCKSNFYY